MAIRSGSYREESATQIAPTIRERAVESRRTTGVVWVGRKTLMRIASLTLLCLAVMLPALAQVLYDNGPINGNVEAWTINFGYVISDSFTLLNNSTVGGFNLGAWEFPGDILTSVDWAITSQADGGTLYGSGTASGSNLTDQ